MRLLIYGTSSKEEQYERHISNNATDLYNCYRQITSYQKSSTVMARCQQNGHSKKILYKDCLRNIKDNQVKCLDCNQNHPAN